MKKIALILLAPAYLLLVAGFSFQQAAADKPGKPAQVFFWKNADPEIIHHLYIDNKLQGVVPFLPDSLTSHDNEWVQSMGLKLSLVPGQYDIVAKDSNGSVLSEGSLKLEWKGDTKNISTSWNNNICKAEMVFND